MNVYVRHSLSLFFFSFSLSLSLCACSLNISGALESIDRKYSLPFWLTDDFFLLGLNSQSHSKMFANFMTMQWMCVSVYICRSVFLCVNLTNEQAMCRKCETASVVCQKSTFITFYLLKFLSISTLHHVCL